MQKKKKKQHKPSKREQILRIEGAPKKSDLLPFFPTNFDIVRNGDRAISNFCGFRCNRKIKK